MFVLTVKVNTEKEKKVSKDLNFYNDHRRLKWVPEQLCCL